LTGANAGEALGTWAATAGDVNGDGYADLVVGAPGAAGGAGQAYLYHGSGGGLSATPALTLSGANAGDGFGRVVGTAGDVNGDGYAEVLVAAPGANSSTGQAYVFAGNGGYNLSYNARVRLASDAGPLAYLGQADSLSQFRLAALGRGPFGRNRLTL